MTVSTAIRPLIEAYFAYVTVTEMLLKSLVRLRSFSPRIR